MNITDFTHRLETARQRMGRMSDGGQGGADEFTATELHAAWEELNVAEEELRQQNDELGEAQQQLERERARFRDLFEAAPDGYVVTDGAGMIREANRAALGLLGGSPRTVVGKPLLTFVAPHDRRALRSLLARLPQLRQLTDWDVMMQPRQAASWPASISVSVVGALGERTLEVRWLIRDIRERRRQQDELRAWKDELEQRVRARTEELERQGRDLSDALRSESELRRRAEESDRAKEAFLGTVSHELRTPLTALLGWVYLVTRGKQDEAALARAYESIERATHAQVKLVDEILDASRIMTGKLALDKQGVDLADLLTSAVATLRPSAVAKSLSLDCAMCEGPIPVMADPDRVQQVVWNLLANAIKFTPPGGAIAVRLERDEEQAYVSVTDSGIGIEPHFLPHVFERFRQGDSSTTRAQGGMGLGLAIARYIVEAHQGTISAASEGGGRGSTFRFSMPLWVGSATPAGAPSPSPHAVPGGPARVLLVDDDEDTREVLVASLELLGFVPTAVASAEAALDLLAREPTDVVVTDIGMPGQDGYALIRAVRALPGGAAASVPVVALTGYSGIESRTRLLHAGFREMLVKPVVPTELSRVLQDIVLAERAKAAS